MSSNTLILQVIGTDSFSAAKLTENTQNNCSVVIYFFKAVCQWLSKLDNLVMLAHQRP
jgi:hypothetical protein